MIGQFSGESTLVWFAASDVICLELISSHEDIRCLILEVFLGELTLLMFELDGEAAKEWPLSGLSLFKLRDNGEQLVCFSLLNFVLGGDVIFNLDWLTLADFLGCSSKVFFPLVCSLGVATSSSAECLFLVPLSVFFLLLFWFPKSITLTSLSWSFPSLSNSCQILGKILLLQLLC